MQGASAKYQTCCSWVPAQWIKQPEGWAFQEGYWDRTLEARGTLFTPAQVANNANNNPADGPVVYQPLSQVSPQDYGLLYGAFGRPNSYYDGYPGVYYDQYGNYYGYASYGNLGSYNGYLDYPYMGNYGYPYMTSYGYGGYGYPYGGYGGYGYARLTGTATAAWATRRYGGYGGGYGGYGGYGGFGYGGGYGGSWVRLRVPERGRFRARLRARLRTPVLRVR